jgi:hypothetical protein
MRRFDKIKNFKKANLLAEQRYLTSKGILKENGPIVDIDGVSMPMGTKEKTDEELLKETEAAKEIAIKKASDDALFQRDQNKLGEENLKVAEDSKKAAERMFALQQLTSTYGGAAVTAALGGNVSALKTLIGSNTAAQKYAATGGIHLNDFIYRGDGTRGTINPISKRDEFFGAKPGGAIDKAINGGGGGVVNIYISGDEAKVYNVVKRVIQESGLRAPAGGR